MYNSCRTKSDPFGERALLCSVCVILSVCVDNVRVKIVETNDNSFLFVYIERRN